MKKAIVLLASCMVVCAMTGCGDSGKEESGKSESSVVETTAENQNLDDGDNEETSEVKLTKKQEYEKDYPYAASLDFAGMPVKDVTLYQDTYNLSDLTGDKLLQFIDYAAEGRLRVEKREGDPSFITCSSVNEILDMKAGEIVEVLLYDLDSDSYQSVKLNFYNSKDGEEEYTVKDCLDKGLWSIEYGPSCFMKERDGRNIPVYGEAYDGSDEEKFNCVEMTTTKFGKPDFYRSSMAFTYEQLEMVYVKGEMALYTCSVLSKRDNVYYTNNGGFDSVVLTPSKNIVSVGEVWENNEFSQLRKVIDNWVCDYALNSDYSHDWRTPDGVIEED